MSETRAKRFALEESSSSVDLLTFGVSRSLASVLDDFRAITPVTTAPVERTPVTAHPIHGKLEPVERGPVAPVLDSGVGGGGGGGGAGLARRISTDALSPPATVTILV